MFLDGSEEIGLGLGETGYEEVGGLLGFFWPFVAVLCDGVVGRRGPLGFFIMLSCSIWTL